ncbi:carboxypeptidase-like regulatory domain-containing protein [Confluentibacter lentus]|uniref:carboxypeptidase-like regulatory domain-containing protein n=1 Tax=Confluentibacter lentus TaxID=1699412 RepID=UPI001E3EB154|nr:carboxypeptidase-like regulatory domain-containing protein [Confluentibacter lentus]
MLKNRHAVLLLILLSFQMGMSQSVEIKGTVESTIGIENINIINKTTYNYAITNANGEFTIMAKFHDTLQFSSMLHKTKYVVVDKNILSQKAIKVTLDEHVNELREVTVGNRLSGDLLKDIKNIKGEPPINFYDVGIQGYTGKIATQSERRLSEASDLELKGGGSLGGIGGSISATALINAISGRTKMLKERVKFEEREVLIQSIKGRLGNDFFASNPLEEHLRMEFFYFCADDESFIEKCKNQIDFQILEFLRMKYEQYLENRSDTED